MMPTTIERHPGLSYAWISRLAGEEIERLTLVRSIEVYRRCHLKDNDKLQCLRIIRLIFNRDQGTIAYCCNTIHYAANILCSTKIFWLFSLLLINFLNWYYSRIKNPKLTYRLPFLLLTVSTACRAK